MTKSIKNNSAYDLQYNLQFNSLFNYISYSILALNVINYISVFVFGTEFNLLFSFSILAFNSLFYNSIFLNSLLISPDFMGFGCLDGSVGADLRISSIVFWFTAILLITWSERYFCFAMTICSFKGERRLFFKECQSIIGVYRKGLTPKIRVQSLIHSLR